MITEGLGGVAFGLTVYCTSPTKLVFSIFANCSLIRFFVLGFSKISHLAAKLNVFTDQLPIQICSIKTAFRGISERINPCEPKHLVGTICVQIEFTTFTRRSLLIGVLKK